MATRLNLMRSHSSKLIMFLLLLSCVIAGRAGAADKNGVSPNAISRPSGPGSLEGLGAAFQPTLNSGTATYSVDLSLPEGVAGFTPDLTLRYDSGTGFGPVGIGWSVGPGSVRRQTEKGLPRYGKALGAEQRPDRFIGADGEELVALANGYYLAKIERSYVRYRPVLGGDGGVEQWVAHRKDGVRLEFGTTPSGRVTDPTGEQVYQWNLEAQTDTHGNVIEYSYILPNSDDRQVYLSEIRYGPGEPPWDHYYTATLSYEDRPDPFMDYRSGFRIRTSKRLHSIEITYDGTLIRRYALGYEAHSHWSLLTTVTQYGADGVSALPVTTFGYATFELCEGGVPFSAAGRVIGSTGEPIQVMDGSLVELADLNADGLPDLLDAGFGHSAYLNLGVVDSGASEAVEWDGPIEVSAIEPRATDLQLSSDNVHLADMTGDGLADLVVTLDYDVEYFGNTGRTGWSAGQLMALDGARPPAPFSESDPHVLTTDLDFDKRIDLIRSEGGAYSNWFNLGGGRYGSPVVTDGVYFAAQFIDFADHGVDLADMNGDRLSDVVKVTSSSVIACASRGFGQFDTCTEIMLHPEDPALTHEQIGRAKLTDINGDGLSDLVVERFTGTDLRFWLNLGDYRLARSCVISDLPATPGSVTRWADINGNGTTDLIYADSSLPESRINAVDVAELIAGSAYFNALTSIDNGFGRRIDIAYRSTSDYYADAYRAGNPWSTSIPFPSAVVSRTRTSIGLDLDGYPDEGTEGDVYITEFVYRDGYYDPLEKQFRGFGFVKHIQHGDERFGGDDAPTLVNRFRFHTGAPDGVDNDGDGNFDEFDEWDGREEEPLKGVELWRESTILPSDPLTDGDHLANAQVFERTSHAWDIRELCTPTGGALADLLGAAYRSADDYERVVRHAIPITTDTSLLELGNGLGVELKHDSDVDPVGNPLFEWNHGDLSRDDDDLYTGYEYARNEAAWIMNTVSREIVADGGPGGGLVRDLRTYYDGMAFEGLPLGQVGDRGLAHRTEALVSPGPVPPLTGRSMAVGDPRDPSGRIDSLREQFDSYGNAIAIRDANGNERHIEYDAQLHAFPITETIIVGDGIPDLIVRATYDYRFGRPITITGMNGNVSTYVFDTFGRLSMELLPGDDPARPSKTLTYALGAPVSSITTIACPNEGDSPDVVTTRFFDGLGRQLGLYEAGGGVMREVTLYNTRGLVRKVYQPYSGGDGTWSMPVGGLPAETTAYDANSRVVRIATAPDEDGTSATETREYQPLRVLEYDGEDNRPAGPHFGTPKTLVSDGLGRLIEVHEIETLSAADSGSFVTKYRYALPDLLAEVEDSNGNIKYMRYDGLGRKIFMNDCDRGHATYTYDPVGNIVQTVDAKGQQSVYTYDGANRLLGEDYLDGGSPLSFERSPDVAYHYDSPSQDYPMLSNARGRLSWVEDLTGCEFLGYNARGDLETVVKRVGQPGGEAMDFTTVTLADNLGRAYQTVYPDGSVVRRGYDARGLVRTIGGFADQITYDVSGQRSRISHSNGVTTEYDYDPRLRLTDLTVDGPSGAIQDLSYEYDQVGNVLSVTDHRVLSVGDPRHQSVELVVDNSYRLAQAVGLGYGTIRYDYDRLGNMVSKTSPDIADSEVNAGSMIVGGVSGTGGRIGRDPDDPPGPHALTLTDNGSQQITYQYDANGNMTGRGGDSLLYDFADRLAQVVTGAHETRYLYDHTNRRIAKRVDGVQTTYIDRLSEVRGGKLLKYVFAEGHRLAQAEGLLPPPVRFAQRFSLNSGWNLLSFQVVPDSTHPGAILSGLAGSYMVVFGYDGGSYKMYEPGGVDNTLHAMLPNHGYWIYMTDAGEFLIEGAVSTVGLEVPEATPVLIGLPTARWLTIEDLGDAYPTVKSVFGYVGETESWECFDRDAPEWVNTLKRTRPGTAYWIVCDQATTLSPRSMGEVATVHHYHADHIRSIGVATDADANVVSQTTYYPYGGVRYEVQADDGASGPGYRFADKELDAETGLYYFERRYLLSKVGRFNRLDPLGATTPRDWLTSPQMFNPYSYSLNNPLSVVDPSGLQPTKATAKATKPQAPVPPATYSKVKWADRAAFGAGFIPYIGGGISNSIQQNMLWDLHKNDHISYEEWKMAQRAVTEKSIQGEAFGIFGEASKWIPRAKQGLDFMLFLGKEQHGALTGKTPPRDIGGLEIVEDKSGASEATRARLRASKPAVTREYLDANKATGACSGLFGCGRMEGHMYEKLREWNEPDPVVHTSKVHEALTRHQGADK